MTLEEALARAYRERPDYLAAQERVQAAESARRAIVGEALPSVRVTADYGAIGLHISSALPTFSIVGALSVPIFEGGRVQGRLAEADSELRTRRAQAEDAKAEIYYDVRTAFLDLKATEEALQTATRGRELADQQLTQSRDRFAAGVTSNIEVVRVAGGRGAGERAVHRRALRLQRVESHARAIPRNGRRGRGEVPRRLGDQMSMRVSDSYRRRSSHRYRCRRLVVDRCGTRVDRRCAGGCAYHADCGACRRDGAPCPCRGESGGRGGRCSRRDRQA